MADTKAEAGSIPPVVEAKPVPSASRPADVDTVVTNDNGKADIVEQRANFNDLTGVKYSGHSDVVSLSAADLKTLGVEETKSEEDLVWSKENDFTVSTASINAATLDALIARPEFSAV